MPIQFPTTGELLPDLYTFLYHTAIFLIILGVGWVAGRVVGNLLGRLVSRAGGDSLLRQTVVGRTLMRSDYTSFKVTRSLTKWMIYLAAFLVAVDTLGLPILTTSVDAFLAYLPDLIASVIILVVGIILSDWVGEFIKKSVTPEKRELLYINYVGDAIKIILYFITITLALSHLGVDVTILYIFADAFAWAIAISVGVAAGIVIGWILKDRIKDWISTISGR